MKRLLVLCVVLPPALVAVTAVAALRGLAPQVAAADPGAPAAATALGIPAAMLTLYETAAAGCPGLSWTVLAAVGAVESDHGRSAAPGVRSGHNRAGAEGPMQFEPATFAVYALPIPPGGARPASPYDPVDAVYAAARMLCADGAARPGGLGAALYAYNHSAAYVAAVRARADGYARGAASTGRAARAVAFALAQVGAPYRWGGEDRSAGFDCSGLAQAAWAAAGVTLPRVASEQFAAGPVVTAGEPLVPGDLVFFGPGPGEVTHVGLVVDPSGVMVDAPHSGAFVRVEAFPVRPGGRWGSDVYLGATAPG